MKKIIKIANIDCANCALKIERAVQKLDGVISCTLNFMTERMTFECEDGKFEEVKAGIVKCTKKVEPDAEIVGLE